LGAVLETVPQVAISAVESANLSGVVVRNYPRKFAVRKQGGDMCVVRVFVVVCIKAAFTFHVVRRAGGPDVSGEDDLRVPLVLRLRVGPGPRSR